MVPTRLPEALQGETLRLGGDQIGEVDANGRSASDSGPSLRVATQPPTTT